MTGYRRAQQAYADAAARNGHAAQAKPKTATDNATAPPRDPKPAGHQVLRTMTADVLMGTLYPEPRWAIDGLLPEGVAFVAGRPKIGKSWLALNLALAVATGGTAIGRANTKIGDVLYLGLEDSDRRMQSRLGTLLARQEIVPPAQLHLATTSQRQHEGGLDAIDKWIAAHRSARLVIVDTFQRFRPPKPPKQDSYEVDYCDVTAIKSIADNRKIAIVLIHHCRKSAAQDPLEELHGSTGLTGAADSILILRRDRGAADAVLHVTGRDIEEQELAMRWDAEFALWSAIGDADEYRQSTGRREIMDLIRTTGRPMGPTEVATALGRDRNATKQMMYQMSTTGQLASANGKYSIRP